jgi:hypothetical protein
MTNEEHKEQLTKAADGIGLTPEEIHDCCHYDAMAADVQVNIEQKLEKKYGVDYSKSFKIGTQLNEVMRLLYPLAFKSELDCPVIKRPWDRTLAWFKWFCDKENQGIIEVARRDLNKDALAMAMEGRSRTFITAAMLCRCVFGTIVPIMWDWLIRLIRAKSFRPEKS